MSTTSESLTAAVDALIPAGLGRPAASEAGVVALLSEQIPKVLPDRAPLIARVAELTAQHGAQGALDRLGADDPAARDLWCETVAGAYFMVPAVRRAIGYPGQVRVPAARPVAEFTELVQPILDAGFAPRLAPGDGPR